MWLLLSYLVTLHVLRLGSADFRVVGPDRPLQVTVGQDIVLPCHLSPSVDARSLDIRWIEHHISEMVHHYRNGEDLYSEQLRECIGRTELVRDGLSSGRLDLQISGLRPSDDGQYVCTVTNGASYGEAMVKLEVAATGSVPQLSLEAYEDGGMRVVCRSAGWYPRPEVLWKDPDGQHLTSVSQRHSSDARGLFGIEDVIVSTDGNRHGKWSCVVRNSRLNQQQETSLHISAPFFHNARPWMVGVAVLLMLSLVFLGLSAYLWRRKAWRKFLLPHHPDVVTLDPNSAHPDLVLMDARSLDIRWIRHQVSETVHHYRNGEDFSGDQTEEYVGRTELVRDGLSSGRLNLRISGLRPSDDGQYICTVTDGASYGEATVDVEVAVSQRHSSDARGLFDIEGVIVVSNGNRRGKWSCVVRNSRLNQELETSLHISAPFFHNARPWMVGVAVLLMLSLVFLGLAAYLWRRKDVVTLDPNSAHSQLVLSADGRSVRRGRARQDLPDTPERFDTRCCVLGQEGFREGRHCWEVEVKGEVGGDSWWAVGVARDSVDRKGDPALSPAGGVWGVQHWEGHFVSLTSRPRSLGRVPRRFWVCLDCTQGLVTFIDADSGVEIFTFPPALFNGETIRPWFWVETEETQLCLRDCTS
ncbi:butyrophilin subfamily 1 member A1-like [Grus japonensis]|uniref:Butyrophilin subfamily 1 member A1-like n=1 Tax=Grus japonensis TaxID=30415 RepID=A0ABC9XXK5_GRUJA